jgi:hypothetical protein
MVVNFTSVKQTYECVRLPITCQFSLNMLLFMSLWRHPTQSDPVKKLPVEWSLLGPEVDRPFFHTVHCKNLCPVRPVYETASVLIAAAYNLWLQRNGPNKERFLCSTQYFSEPKISFPFSQKPATCLYPVSDDSSACTPSLFLCDVF